LRPRQTPPSTSSPFAPSTAERIPSRRSRWFVKQAMRFEFFVAARYLRAKRRQAVVGAITTISIIGVAVGVASLIIALAITSGMRRDLQSRLLSSTAHVELMRTMNDGIKDWQPL